MDSLGSESCLMDEELLDFFSSDIVDEEENTKRAVESSLRPNGLLVGPPDSVRPRDNHSKRTESTRFQLDDTPESVSQLVSFAEAHKDLQEEELEWIDNKASFPGIESMGILPAAASAAAELLPSKHHSPVSVLEGSTTSSTSSGSTCTTLTTSFATLPPPPRRARSKRRCRRRRCSTSSSSIGAAPAPSPSPTPATATATEFTSRCVQPAGKQQKRKAGPAAISGRQCLHCGSDRTPQWRAGPHGPKTLCNACGVRYKSGRLVPEYRPASSPTFSSELHSNSHRKVVEMRKVKQVMGLVVNQPLVPGCNSNFRV